jgi:GNAT superfamily N-acetyltransferase
VVPAAADLTLRPATLDDAPFVADMFTALWPTEPEDPVLTRYWWEHPWDNGTYERYVAALNGRAAAFVGVGHPSWDQMPERYARLQGDLLPAFRSSERLGALLAFAEERARSAGALRVTKWAREQDRLQISVLGSRGYREERRERFWELDIRARRGALEAMAAASREHMRAQGIEVTTLDRVADPEKYRRLWQLSEEASQDTPRTVPWTPTPFAAFEAWLRNPGVREDRAWVARIGDEIVGISLLTYPPVRGVVQTEWTGTARSVRGRGVARALKCETVMEATALGVDRIRTDNDSQNKPILHINESMGYQPRPEMVQFIKELAHP